MDERKVENCWHSPDKNDPGPGDRCRFCRVEITWTGPAERDWDPVEGWRDGAHTPGESGPEEPL